MSELNDTMPEKPTRGVLREIVRDAVIVTALSALVAWPLLGEAMPPLAWGGRRLKC